MNDLPADQPVGTCAPELAVTIDARWRSITCSSAVSGTVSVAYPLVGQFIQVKLGSASRVVVNPGQVPGDACIAASCALVIANADTLLTSAANGSYPQLNDHGVPFGYIDREPKNNFRYFYSVTAFDVNSYQSGPSSLESPRLAKPVTPSVQGSNVADPAGDGSLRRWPRTLCEDSFTIDPVTACSTARRRLRTGFPASLHSFRRCSGVQPDRLIDSVRAPVDVPTNGCDGVENSYAMCYIFYVIRKGWREDTVRQPTPWPVSTSACCGDPTRVITSQLGAGGPHRPDRGREVRHRAPPPAGCAAVTSPARIHPLHEHGRAGGARNLFNNNTAAQCPRLDRA